MREAEPGDRHFIADLFQSHWLLFVLVGAMLIIAGLVACTVPAVSSIAPNELLGLVLAFVGIVQTVQSGKMQGEALFAWHLTLGLLAALGGILLYLDPFPGIVTITALMAIVFALHGLTQIAFALKVRQLKGWHWFVASGCIALIVAGLLMMKLPYDHTFTPASVGGVSLLFAGWAYVAVALTKGIQPLEGTWFGADRRTLMFARAVTALIAVLCLADVSAFAQPQSAGPSSVILFENVRIFDGKSSTLSGTMNVLIHGNTINKISKDPVPVDRSAGTRIIAGGGRTLMPGLIDMHWHAMLVRPTVATLLTADIGYTNLVAGAEATDTLMRGFTTVRDVGGPVFGLKRAIDEGVVAGPRIYPSGAIITVTSGHGDFRQPFEVPRVVGSPQSRGEQVGAAMIADSPDEVRVRVREQLLLGASQIKLTAGGGVASPHSPLDASTFTEAELRAAVEAAENWGTYVTVHAYTPESIRRSIAAGVKCIEHGHLMDDETAKLIADKGIWSSTQAFPDELANAFPPGSLEALKARVVFVGTDKTFTLAKKYGIKTAFGTDILFSPQLAPHQGELLAKLVRWYTSAETLIMATGTNAQLLALSGERSPYPGKLGVIEQGALADLLLVDGDPIANIKLIEDPAKNFVVIVKDGKIFKNAL